MRLADASVRPPIVHLGGPAPVLDSRSQLRVGIRLLDVVAPSKAAKAEHGRLAKLAVRCAADADIPRRELDDATAKSRTDEPAIAFAKQVARAGMHYLHSPPSARDSIGGAIESGVCALVTAVADVGALFARVDAELCRAELAQMLEERSLDARLVRVTGRAGVDGRIAAIAASLEGAAPYGLMVKLVRRWEWHTGDRATVFATVPDAFMDDLAPAFP